MFYDKEISILGETGYTNEYGRWIETENPVVLKTIDADVQPYNKSLAYRDYAFEADVKWRVFCNIEPLIKLGTTIQYKGKNYNVVNITEWDEDDDNGYLILLLDD